MKFTRCYVQRVLEFDPNKNLSRLDLSRLDLSDLNLSEANLSWAYLHRADLRRADLSRADLSGADLRRADLRGAKLSGADLSWADLPSPAEVLLCSWGEVSNRLCADLMEYDASNHPDRNKFVDWASGGPCPYTDCLVSRAANFSENMSLFGEGTLRSAYSLMMSLFAEKGIKR